MSPTTGDVLVAVADPAHVQQLVRTASDLARVSSGDVRLVTVAVKPYDSPFGVFDDDTIRRDFAGDSKRLLDAVDAPADITLTRDVVVGRSVASGLRSAVESADPAALVVGWGGVTDRSDAALGTTVDTLVERVPCDLYVERTGREADGVESVLLPVAGGPHVEPAGRIAVAIAAANEARVSVVSVETGSGDAESHVTDAAATLRAIDSDVSVTTAVLDDGSIPDAIAGVADDHDVLVLGATRGSGLRRRLLGSVPTRVADRTDSTLILARAGSVVGGPLDRVGKLIGR